MGRLSRGPRVAKGAQDSKNRPRSSGSQRAMRFTLIVAVCLLVVGLLHDKRGPPALNIRAHTAPPAPAATMTNSTTATVMGIATNYNKYVFKGFVGSLRKVGYKGHIILAVSPDIDADSEAYLRSKNVILKKLEYEECQHSFGKPKEGEELDSHQKEVRTCVKPYPLLKHRWGRFPKLRDFLKECETCTGPVLVTDVRDTFFQRDPFGDGQPQVEGLQVFMEHKSITTQNWLVEWPVRECKGITFDKPMLCSGTTIGTRQAMLDYLQIMHDEMMLWMADPKCHFDTNGDDQSVHNYLYYSGKLPFAKAIPNRQGIVHTVGAQGSIINTADQKFRNDLKEKGADQDFIEQHATLWEVNPHDVHNKDDPNHKKWMKLDYDLIDEEGFILDYDAQRSSVIHQYDRFGYPLESWLRHWSGLVDKE